VKFYERTANSYKVVERKGTGVTDYYWVETHADGTKYYYGTKDGASLEPNATLTFGNGKIVKWFLSRVVDKWGNYIDYTYDNDMETAALDARNSGRYAKLSKIEYTGKVGGAAPKYSVEFKTTKNRRDA